jgi:D-alanyl-D-alanine carboxypeptidase
MEITRLAPARVLVLGDAAAVAESVLGAVQAIVPDTVRLDEARYTNLSIAAIRLAFPEGARHVYVINGSSDAGSLTGGALAAAKGAPVLVVSGGSSAPTDAQRALLDDLGTTTVTLFGSTASISKGIASGLGAGRTATRIEGSGRYGMSAAVAARFPTGGRELVLAYGHDTHAALAGAVLAAKRKAPLMLTGGICAESSIRSVASKRSVRTVMGIGGVPQLRGNAIRLTQCLSTTDPKSPWVLVNKKNPLSPKGYFPGDLRAVRLSGGYWMRDRAATALEQMSRAARAAGKGSLGLVSGFRSQTTQASIYNRYVSQKGRAAADLTSARPGYSEHQTGFAADVVACNPGCGSAGSFGSTATGKWVAANAYRFGFIVRYEKGRTAVTGYSSEPWHLRWVGTVLAKDYHNGGFHTLEEYLRYPAAPKY